ncbi:multiple ankyrin repeats single kh domain [Moniliophthora roreri MCA 2997]|uniref:Multiple ankyrin repeats single kh domain n=1 Tax=Moniliophthora roreri (strain MCA 2997) TaxID=1381753 RepID=V2WUH2_MONRO|nr:multiple ankyrin repeats single kh domain [Moniliophthora roreri MCA 2997]
MVQAQTLGLSSFHATIVLSLSWMNNTNTFIYFLLYVQHKSQDGLDQVKPEWSSWIAHIGKKLWLTAPQNEDGRDEESLGSNNPANLDLPESKQRHRGTEHQQPLWIRGFIRKIVLSLGSLHLSIMAALGIWLWVDSATMVILGNHVPLSLKGLHMGSLVIYLLFLTPGLNLVIPMGAFLAIPPSIIPIIIGMLMLLAINIIFLVDIELTLQQNQHLQEDSNESRWTFGQTLALLLLAAPLHDILEAIFEHWERRHREGDARAFKNAILNEEMEAIKDLVQKGVDVSVEVKDQENKSITALQLASYKGDSELVSVLLDHGAKPDVKGDKYGKALEAALQAEKLDIMKLLVEKGRNTTEISIQGGEYGTALQAVSYEGNLEIVKLLLEKGAAPNVEGGKYGTALQAASWRENLDIVELLLEKRAEPNIKGGKYGTALQAALWRGNHDIVKLLLEKEADPNVKGGNYGTALQAASWRGNLDIVKLLLEKGADPNVKGGKYGTALQAASWRENLDIVKLLLEKEADPNVEGGKYGTALQAALSEGKLEIVKLLLEKGADPNVEGGKYRTALQAASWRENLDIVKLLLEKGADSNVKGENYF